jgi:hypothetical protein
MNQHLSDTQSRIETARGESFPYQFGTDLLQTKIVVYNTETNTVMSIAPAEAQRKATDPSLDPHRHALYSAAWEYWQSQQVQS